MHKLDKKEETSAPKSLIREGRETPAMALWRNPETHFSHELAACEYDSLNFQSIDLPFLKVHKWLSEESLLFLEARIKRSLPIFIRIKCLDSSCHSDQEGVTWQGKNERGDCIDEFVRYRRTVDEPCKGLDQKLQDIW